MRRTVPLERTPVRMVLTAEADSCAFCGAETRVCQHRRRRIHDLDQTIDLICRDKACTNPECPNPCIRFRPMEEATLALPGHEFSLDVVTEIGSMRLRDDFSFPRIHERLRERLSPVPICAMSVQYQFRNYLSLVGCRCDDSRPAARRSAPVPSCGRRTGAVTSSRESSGLARFL